MFSWVPLGPRPATLPAMTRLPLLSAALGLALLAPTAQAAEYVPDEVVVRYAPAAGDARVSAHGPAAAARTRVV